MITARNASTPAVSENRTRRMTVMFESAWSIICLRLRRDLQLEQQLVHPRDLAHQLLAGQLHVDVRRMGRGTNRVRQALFQKCAFLAPTCESDEVERIHHEQTRRKTKKGINEVILLKPPQRTIAEVACRRP